jgi:DNA-binding CsgD family transcriptional regulator/catechol 2,3-dioxygenase-like lactoylglutathione lyase family enzyme
MAQKQPRGRPPHADVLTPAEWGVVDAMRHGMSLREIARRRGVSLDAVKYHRANALQKLGLADRRALRAWTGIRRDSRLSATELHMQEPLHLGAIGQVGRSVSDIVASEAWYRDVLGLPHLYTFGRLAFFDLGGVRLLLEQGAVGPQSVLYFKVPDIRSAHARLLERGVRFESAPHLIHRHADGTEEWMAFFLDPDDRLLAIMSQVAATAPTP